MDNFKLSFLFFSLFFSFPTSFNFHVLSLSHTSLPPFHRRTPFSISLTSFISSFSNFLPPSLFFSLSFPSSLKSFLPSFLVFFFHSLPPIFTPSFSFFTPFPPRSLTILSLLLSLLFLINFVLTCATHSEISRGILHLVSFLIKEDKSLRFVVI